MERFSAVSRTDALLSFRRRVVSFRAIRDGRGDVGSGREVSEFRSVSYALFACRTWEILADGLVFASEISIDFDARS